MTQQLSNVSRLDRGVTRTYLAHALVALDETMHGFDRQEAIVNRYILLSAMDDIRRNDSSEIVNVHLAATLLIDMAERRHPVQESEQHFHGISVWLR